MCQRSCISIKQTKLLKAFNFQRFYCDAMQYAMYSIVLLNGIQWISVMNHERYDDTEKKGSKHKILLSQKGVQTEKR